MAHVIPDIRVLVLYLLYASFNEQEENSFVVVVPLNSLEVPNEFLRGKVSFVSQNAGMRITRGGNYVWRGWTLQLLVDIRLSFNIEAENWEASR